jgi:hypothetical protein
MCQFRLVKRLIQVAGTSSSDAKVTDPKGIDVFDFDVIEENWNHYDLEDGTKVRSRIILTRVARPKQGFKQGQYDLSFAPFFMITADSENRGTPGPPLTPEEVAIKPEDITAGSKIPVKVITSSEQWNVYRVNDTGDMFRVKMLITEAYRIKDRFDQFGEPMYGINHSPVVAPVAKGYEKVDLRGKAKPK